MTRYNNIPSIQGSIIILVLVMMAAIVFSEVGHHEFVNYDDYAYVYKNPQVQTGLTSKGVVWAFTTTHTGNWHPLTWLSHMLDVQLFGLNPGWHHLVNLLLHIVNVVLLFLVLQLMTGDLWQSGVTAALFAIHPLHVESVAWIAERKDVLSTSFWILTLVIYVWFIRKPKLTKYLLLVIAYAAGLMAKPMLITLPFVLLLLDYWPMGRWGAAGGNNPKGYSERSPYSSVSQWQVVLEKIPLIILSIASSVFTYLAQQHGKTMELMATIPFQNRAANALVSYIRYLVKMVWPSGLAFFYPHPGVSLPIWQPIGAGLLIIVVSVAVVAIRRRYQYLPVGWFWYLGTLVPVIGLIQVGHQAMADRYTYVPLIGFWMAIVWGIFDLAARWRYGKIILPGLFIVSLAALMVAARIQAGYWLNSVTLSRHAVEVTSDNYLAHHTLGMALEARGELDEATENYLKAVTIKPDFTTVYVNLGVVFTLQGRLKEASSYYQQALRINPNHILAHNNLGTVLTGMGRIEEAIYHHKEALQINPNYASSHNNLGLALHKLKRYDEAIDHYRKALQIQPDSAVIHDNLGQSLVEIGNLEEAKYHFQEAIRFDPAFKKAYYHLENALRSQK